MGEWGGVVFLSTSDDLRLTIGQQNARVQSVSNQARGGQPDEKLNRKTEISLSQNDNGRSEGAAQGHRWHMKRSFLIVVAETLFIAGGLMVCWWVAVVLWAAQ